jgi:deoxyribodipyrimidine photo-lyase
MLDCLSDLDGALRERGSRLVVRRGAPERELARLVEELGADEVHVSADVSPFARRRDDRISRAIGERLRIHPGLTVVDDVTALTTQAGKPYTVFTPFHRRWLDAPRRDVLGAPRELASPPAGDPIPTLAELGLEQEVDDPLPGGESAGRERLRAWVADGVGSYADAHDALGDDGTSRLSAYLHFGCVSPREVEQRLPRGKGAETFRRQLCWRDFYHHVLFHFPRNARSEFQDRYRGSIRWSRSEGGFDAWCEGRTGFPLVDAAMRQLRREGFIHNRGRLVAGSFLTKDLGIDWRWGERHFMRYLIDGDEANNNGNWQWIASVGTDPQPAFRRIYNPARQQERHDPRGDYVRRYVEELRSVPDDYLAEPWTMPAQLQRECGCVIGTDYPEPVVDHAQARREALERYRV